MFKKGLIFKLVAIVIMVIVLASGIMVLGYYTFFPAKLTLKAASYVSARKIYNTVDKNIALYEEKYIKPLLESTIQKKMTAGLNVDKELLSQFLPEESVDEILKHINKIALKYDYKMDMQNKMQSVRLGLNYFLNPILTFRMSLNGNRFGIGIDELTNKTIVGDMKDLGELTRFFPDTQPELWDALENTDPWITKNCLEEIRFDRDDLKEVIFGYSKDIIDSIDSEDITIKRAQTTDVLDDEIKCQEITIKLDGKDQKRIADIYLEKFKENDSLYNLIFGNLNKYISIMSKNPYYKELFASSGLEDMFGKDKYLEILSQFEEELDSIEQAFDITVKIYIDGFDIVKYELSTHIDDNPEPVVIINEQRYKDHSYDLKLTAKGDFNTNGELNFRIKRDYDERNDLSNLAVTLDLTDNDPDNKYDFSISIFSNEDLADRDEVNHTLDFIIEAKSPASLANNSFLKMTLDGTKIRDAKKQVIESDYKGNISMSLPSAFIPEQLNLGFYFNTESVYGEDFKIPEPDEVLDIKTATQEEFDQLSNEISTNIKAMLQLLGVF